MMFNEAILGATLVAAYFNFENCIVLGLRVTIESNGATGGYNY
jgi:hypothetical protein